MENNGITKDKMHYTHFIQSLGTIATMRQLLIIIIIGSIVFVNCTSQNEFSYEDGYITISDGNRLYYEKVGNGPEVILISSGMYYSPIFKQLASSERTLIIYDQRGRGKSSAIKDSTQLGWMKEADDIESIRQHFKFKTINIIGTKGLCGQSRGERKPSFINIPGFGCTIPA